MMHKPMSDEEFDEAVKAQKWTFAKTYADKAPHEYFIDKQNPMLFQEIKRRIVLFGTDGHFYAVKRKYYIRGPYRYWDMDNVMNRDDKSLKYDLKPEEKAL